MNFFLFFLFMNKFVKNEYLLCGSDAEKLYFSEAKRTKPSLYKYNFKGLIVETSP